MTKLKTNQTNVTMKGKKCILIGTPAGFQEVVAAYDGLLVQFSDYVDRTYEKENESITVTAREDLEDWLKSKGVKCSPASTHLIDEVCEWDETILDSDTTGYKGCSFVPEFDTEGLYVFNDAWMGDNDGTAVRGESLLQLCSALSTGQLLWITDQRWYKLVSERLGDSDEHFIILLDEYKIKRKKDGEAKVEKVVVNRKEQPACLVLTYASWKDWAAKVLRAPSGLPIQTKLKVALKRVATYCGLTSEVEGSMRNADVVRMFLDLLVQITEGASAL